jgi:hypothetical protein
VRYSITVKHWVLYTLDALEYSTEPDDNTGTTNQTRDSGAYPEDIFDFAAREESIVFKSAAEVGTTLSKLTRTGPQSNDDPRALNRRTDRTEWDTVDVEYRYRLNTHGRKALLDLGVPTKLPNHRDYDTDDRRLDVQPSHVPGWWQKAYEHYDDEWAINANDWLETDHERVFAKDEADFGMLEDRGIRPSASNSLRRSRPSRSC